MSRQLAQAVTGVVLVDLREVKPDRAHMRVGNRHTWPDGAHVLLIVGALAVNPDVVRLLHQQLPRVSVEVHGEAWAVGHWVAALRGVDMLTDELPFGVTA